MAHFKKHATMYKSNNPNAIQHTIKIPKISEPELAAIQIKKNAAIERKLAKSVAKLNKSIHDDHLNAAILETYSKYPEKQFSSTQTKNSCIFK